jgi:hypothetical protein
MANPKRKPVVKTTTKKTSVPQFQPLTNGQSSAYSNAINFTPNDALSYTAGVGMPVPVDYGNGMTTTSYGQQFGNTVSPFDAYKANVAKNPYQSFNGGDEGDFDYSSIGDNLNPASIDLAEMPNLPTNSNSFNWGPLTGSGTAIKDFVGTDAFKFISNFSKTGTTGTTTIRVKVNTTNTFVGATNIATFTTVNTNRDVSIMRFRHNFNGTNLVFYNPTASNLSDITAGSAFRTSVALNPANSIFLFVSIQNTDNGDSTVCDTFHLTN